MNTGRRGIRFSNLLFDLLIDSQRAKRFGICGRAKNGLIQSLRYLDQTATADLDQTATADSESAVAAWSNKLCGTWLRAGKTKAVACWHGAAEAASFSRELIYFARDNLCATVLGTSVRKTVVQWRSREFTLDP